MSALKPSPVARFLEVGLNLIGTDYLWWAKGEEFGQLVGDKFQRLAVPSWVPGKPGFALDCSGGVTYPLWRAGGPDLRWSHNTDKLWTERPPVKVPVPGDYAFYGGKAADDVDHVMTVLAILPTGEILVMGPSGGDRTTTTLERARAQGARWKVKTSHLYRPDFRGFRAGHFTQS